MTYQEAMRRAAVRYWKSVMTRAGRNVGAAAAVAGTNRTSTYKLLRKFGVPFKSKRGNWGTHGL
jgi:hypothetical protein